MKTLQSTLVEGDSSLQLMVGGTTKIRHYFAYFLVRSLETFNIVGFCHSKPYLDHEDLKTLSNKHIEQKK